ncbi:hypothetical protein [Pseudanabaena sp. FACHB-2040]|uniref:hypothetical protein n=1 Tax=Pseudanabaena sp. FACHB-2040 TaxID=2692859 RepID=UPI00168407EB|nr:hypothetical protein [Pseudanabaena sp. FACHB-2040]MBD2259905.1 hypothetical protein [Pseudanabaena sp. FACHB-2040]
MSRFKKDDRSLIEISNDKGDHWVAEIPTSAVRKAEKALKEAGCKLDYDESTPWFSQAEKERDYERRDHNQHRYRSARVVNEGEDLEDNHDRELDLSDYEDTGEDLEDNHDRELDLSDHEADEQPTSPWWR